MPFSKSFPRTVKGSTYPMWEEIFLTEDEEKEEEQKCRKENIRLMQECIEDSKIIVEKKALKKFQSDMIKISIALFDKRASHAVYWKENKAKEKFDKKFGN
ncbi:MAG: hypothetical protein KAK00_04810 [Nanoarchaeota archaeon]|nr:hypothetical protein [Nanoarchaeota archaeon]